jgi:hypothetical protein
VKLSDSCDPEAVKEQLAKDEPVPISDEEDMGEEKVEKEAVVVEKEEEKVEESDTVDEEQAD